MWSWKLHISHVHVCALCFPKLAVFYRFLKWYGNSLDATNWTYRRRLFCFVFFWWYWSLNSGPCTWAMPWVLFALVIFSGRVFSFCLGLTSNRHPPTYSLLNSWNYKCKPPHTACLLRWGLTGFFAWAGFRSWSSQFLPPEYPVLQVWAIMGEVFCYSFGEVEVGGMGWRGRHT
jgi:hypothetical protein